MNGKTPFVVATLLLVASLFANAWLLGERQKMVELREDIEKFTVRLERLTATVGVLTVILSDKLDIEIPWPFELSK